jgi:hypothetical protein
MTPQAFHRSPAIAASTIPTAAVVMSHAEVRRTVLAPLAALNIARAVSAATSNFFRSNR